ncbi:MAG: hypothetical protein FWG91_05705 [Lachnospiraceae bacterium]|nr:hypothetical protein [Lachnospiraceae bacterium]
MRLNILSGGGSSAISDAQTAVQSGLTEIAGGMTSTLSMVIPIALGIVGAVMLVVFGVRLFKKLSGKA